MPVKHFVIDPAKRAVSKGAIEDFERRKQASYQSEAQQRESRNAAILEADEGLLHPEGRVIIKINLEGKNSHRFADGTVIRRERQFDNFNRRETEAVNAVCVSGAGITNGAQILIHHNAATETYRITNYKNTLGSDIQYYSIPTEQCFLWLDGNSWKPLPPFETALRVFKPYEGMIEGIEPTLLKDTLFVTSGDLAGQVVQTVMAADYEVVFQNTNGVEGRVIRFRPHGCDKTEREPEAIAVLHEQTELVNNGKLLVGLSKSDAKKLSEYAD